MIIQLVYLQIKLEIFKSMESLHISLLNKYAIIDTSRRASMNVPPVTSPPKIIKRPSFENILDEDFIESRPSLLSMSSVSSQNIIPRIHSSLLNDTKKNHRGVLYFKAKKSFTAKWCILTNVDFSYFNEQYSLVIPKEQISLYAILSITRHVLPQSYEDNENPFYCFDITFSTEGGNGKVNYSSSAKYIVRTFGTTTVNERDTWVDRITQSLSPKLATFTMTNHTSNSR